MRAKTGWAMRVSPQIGWYVGYIEKNDEVWFFSINVLIKKKSDAQYRKQLMQMALKVLNII